MGYGPRLDDTNSIRTRYTMLIIGNKLRSLLYMNCVDDAIAGCSAGRI